MDLLIAHKVLISFTIVLGLALAVWGFVHGVYRHEPDAIGMMILGGLAWPVAAVYLIRLQRHPPIH